MAIRLLIPLWGHAANVIVRDVSYDLERRLVEKNFATYDLETGVEQSRKTVDPNTSWEEQKLIESENDIVFSEEDGPQTEKGLTPAQIDAGAIALVALDQAGNLIDKDGNVIEIAPPSPGGNGFTDNSGSISDSTQTAISETETGKTCAEFLATIRNPTTNQIHSAKFLVNVESGSVLMTQYADLRTGLELGQFDADLNGGKLRLLFTKTTANNVTFVTSVYAH